MIQSLLLAVALLTSPSVFAQSDGPDAVPNGQEAPQAIKQDPDKPAPQLIRLDKSLTKAQDDKTNGRIDEKHYQEFLTKFRADLTEAMSRVKPTPPNTALHARILSRLGDSEQALAALGPAIKQDPDSPALRVAASQVHYDQKDYPSALAEANAALAIDPTNKEALALKHFSEGRTAAVAGDEAPKPDAADFARPDWTIPEKNDISPKALTLIYQGIAARRKGDVEEAWGPIQEAMNADPTSTNVQAIYGKFKADRDKYRETRSYLENAADAIHAGRGDVALSWARKAYERDPNEDTLSVVEDVQRRSAALAAKHAAAPGPQDAASKPVPSNGIPNPGALAACGAAGAALGMAACLLWRRRSDNPGLHKPVMLFAMAGIGMSGSILVGDHFLSKSRAVTDVGMYGENRAPLLQGEPNVGQAPGGRPDCADQLKKFYPQQQDAQQKRQSALIVLQPILDKYGLSYEKFQSEFPKLVASYVASCDADPAACQLMADKADWAAAQASYGQIQVLDLKLQTMSAILAKLMDKCAIPGSKEKDRRAKKDAETAQNSEKQNATLAKREAVATAENSVGEPPDPIAENAAETAPSQATDEAKPSSRKTGKMAVLGPYPTYVKLAEDMDSKYFNIPPDAWAKMSKEEQWLANRKFLDRAASRGEVFILAINYDEVGPKTQLRKEIDYLKDLGYRPSNDGRMLIRIKSQ